MFLNIASMFCVAFPRNLLYIYKCYGIRVVIHQSIFYWKNRCFPPLRFTTKLTSCSTFERQIESSEPDKCFATHNIHIPSVFGTVCYRWVLGLAVPAREMLKNQQMEFKKNLIMSLQSFLTFYLERCDMAISGGSLCSEFKLKLKLRFEREKLFITVSVQ